MYVFICDPSLLQSLLPIQTLTIDKRRMKRWNTDFTSENNLSNLTDRDKTEKTGQLV